LQLKNSNFLMIKLRNDIQPNADILLKLAQYQEEIDELDGFNARSNKARELFALKNNRHNAVFRALKDCLTALCNSTRRCVYCEDSLADEVEHIYPKNLYPDKCFDWNNYVYACGPCNGPKNDKFAIFIQGSNDFVRVNPVGDNPAVQPPDGDAVLINPRNENPLEIAILDLFGSFMFYPKHGISERNSIRVNYTCNEVLRLNSTEREPLRQARENAYGMYKARLFEYVRKKEAGYRGEDLQKLVQGIKKENHPTVWKEMQRYYIDGLLSKVDMELKDLFDRAKESLNW
jgi:hypothetical protein